MRAVLILTTALCGCSAQQQTEPPPTVDDSSPVEPAHVVAAAPDLEWDPRTPIEGEVELRRMFVTAEVASVCPTVELARTNECGNSVEHYEYGLRFKRGEVVSIVGDAPVHGFWRSVRFTKMGRLPGWVDASRVAMTPDLAHVEKFREAHPGAIVVAADQLAVAYETPPPDDPDARNPFEPTVFLTRIKGVETALVTGECFGIQGEYFLPYPWSHHNCLKYGDCIELDYVCEEDGYCDEILFVLDDREPFEVLGKQVPAKTVTALADRVDVFGDVEDCQR